MREILRTTDPALISFVENLLKESGIIFMIVDKNTSTILGSVDDIPARFLIRENEFKNARKLLAAAGLGNDLGPISE